MGTNMRRSTRFLTNMRQDQLRFPQIQDAPFAIMLLDHFGFPYITLRVTSHWGEKESDGLTVREHHAKIQSWANANGATLVFAPELRHNTTVYEHLVFKDKEQQVAFLLIFNVSFLIYSPTAEKTCNINVIH